jgi:hypothetical protein
MHGATPPHPHTSAWRAAWLNKDNFISEEKEILFFIFNFEYGNVVEYFPVQCGRSLPTFQSFLLPPSTGV